MCLTLAMEPPEVTERARALGPRGRLWGRLLVACGLLLVGRFLVVRVALGAASDTGLMLSEMAKSEAPPPSEEAEEEPEPEPVAPVAEDEDEDEELALPPQGSQGSQSGPKSKRRTPVAPEQQSFARLGADEVLAFANRGQVPRGSSVAARGNCPAGIRLRNVGGFGLGLSDGDLLVQVGGTPVTERSEVVSAVLAARGRKEGAVEALVLRPSTGCSVGYRVTVEQPYPTDAEVPEPSLTSERRH